MVKNKYSQCLGWSRDRERNSLRVYEYLLNIYRVWWYTIRLVSAVDLTGLPLVQRNLYRDSLEIEMQTSFPFWRVGNNEHEGIWESIPFSERENVSLGKWR